MLTGDRLQKRDWLLANKCIICKSKEESIDHILLHWAKVRVFWHLLFSLFDVVWVISSTIKETLLNWHDSFVHRKHKKFAKPLLYAFLDNLEGK